MKNMKTQLTHLPMADRSLQASSAVSQWCVVVGTPDANGARRFEARKGFGGLLDCASIVSIPETDP